MPGKVFYIELDGEGRHPVLHFGMTGMLQVCEFSSYLFDSEGAFSLKIRGNMPVHYREAPRKASTDWPPRFMKVDSLLIKVAQRPFADRLSSSFFMSLPMMAES
jgi:hypothetical protein